MRRQSQSREERARCEVWRMVRYVRGKRASRIASREGRVARAVRQVVGGLEILGLKHFEYCRLMPNVVPNKCPNRYK